MSESESQAKPPVELKYEIHAIETVQGAKQALDHLRGYDSMAADTETVGIEGETMFNEADRWERTAHVPALKAAKIQGIYDRAYKNKKVIKTANEILQYDEESSLSPKARAYLDIYKRKAARAAGMVDNLRETARKHPGGLYFHQNKLGAVQAGCREESGSHTAFIIRPEVLDAREFQDLCNSRRRLLFQVCQFDWKMLYHHLGIELHCENLWDTQVAEYVLTNGTGLKTNLKFLAERHLGIDLDKDPTVRVANWTGEWKPNMIEYGGLDVVVPFYIQEQQQKLLELNPKAFANFKFQCQGVPDYARMEMNGIGVDIERANQLLAEKEPIRRDALVQCGLALKDNDSTQHIVDIDEVESIVNSSKQLKEVLINRGHDITSTDASVLATLKDDPLAKAVGDYRKVNKLISTYIKPFISRSVWIDGELRIFANFNAFKVETSRFSSDDPNLQNMPATYEFRSVVVPRLFCVLIDGDLSSIEPRILTELSQDPLLVDWFSRGLDVYKMMAEMLLGVPYDQVTKEQRKFMKPVLLGVMYGKTVGGLAYDLKVSYKEAQKLRDKFFATFIGVKRWVKQTLDDARRDGFIETLDGFRRYIPDINSDNKKKKQHAENQALNTKIQGLAARLMKEAIRLLGKELRKPEYAKLRLVITAHDELLVECPDVPVEISKAQELVKWALIEGARKWIKSVPITVGEEPDFECQVLRNWGEAKAA